MPNAIQSTEPQFHNRAIEAFDRTFSVLYEQAHEEADRLSRINRTMRMVEDRLLDPTVIETLDPMSLISLADVLGKSQQNAIRSLMGFGKLFMDIKTTVGIRDSIQRATAIPGSPVGGFPRLGN